MPNSASVAIIDTHQHLWDLTRFQLPWLAEVPNLNRNFGSGDYAEAAAELGIEQTVYMEVDVEPAQQAAEAEYVGELCRDPHQSMAAAVIAGRPAAEDFARYLDRFRDNPYVKGVRQILHSDEHPPGECLTQEFVRGMQALGERGLSFDLCMRPGELADAVELARQCPDTQFILDHCGNGDPRAFRPQPPTSQGEPWHQADSWRRDIDALAGLPNVVCKISGIVVRAWPGWTADDLAPIVLHCLEAFGPNRVVFGGDWPVCTLVATLREWVAALREIVRDRNSEEQRKLWHENAARLYGLPQ